MRLGGGRRATLFTTNLFDGPPYRPLLQNCSSSSVGAFGHDLWQQVWVCSNGFLAFDAAESGAVRFALPFQRQDEATKCLFAPTLPSSTGPCSIHLLTR